VTASSHGAEPWRPRVLVVGAGAIGGYLACLLARAGCPVTVLVRPGSAPWGSTVAIVDGPDAGAAEVAVTDTPTDPADLVVFAVKSYDTASAATLARAAVTDATTVLELQNGVDRAAAVDAVLGSGSTLAGTIFLECVREAPGVVRYLSGARRVHLGEADGGGVSDRARAVADVLRAAGLDAHAHDDVRPELWRKFVLVCAANSLTALTGEPFGSILSHPAGRSVVGGIIAEACAVGRASGVDLPSDLEEQSLDLLLRLGPQLRSSMLRDVRAGRQTEVDALNGHVLALAHRLGVAVPRNELVTLALGVRTGRENP